jgi:putative peptide zinc metalloprotease protein
MESISACWALKSDLIVSRQDNDDGVFYVVKDPSTERFYRLKEVENYIAAQCDGQTPKETIRLRVEEKFDVSLSPENLDQFIDRLRKIGLLVDKNWQPSADHRSRFAGDMFYLRCRLFNPDRFLDWLLPKARFFLTPAFIFLSAVTVFFAAAITVASWTDIRHQFYGVFGIEFLVQIWLIMLGVVFLHELAHGLTCKYFGGHVREIGFLLIYFQPAFYCNVSDAWLFPQKAHRMWVTFAGGYFEIFLWALATITWRATDPGTGINHLALVVTATSGFKMFFNMNPLIKLDGYYLLCDWLDIPNLRPKAAEYFTSRIKKLFGFAYTPTSEVSARRRSFFIFYSILSAAYIYWILIKILLWFGDFMVSRFQAWGFAIFLAVLMVMLRKPLRNVFSSIGSGIRRSKFARPRIPNALIWLAILASAIGALYHFRSDLKVSGPFVVLPQHVAIRAEAEGIIEEIFVNEGDVVKQGDLIARIANRDYEASLLTTQAEIQSKIADLRLLKSGARPEEIQAARAQAIKSDELLKLAGEQLERDQKMVETRLISPSEFENTRELFLIRGKELEEAQGKLSVLESGSRLEQREAVEATIRALQARERFLKQQMLSLDIYSPIEGVVTTHKLHERLKENVKKGDLVTEVYAIKTVNVEIAVPEKEIGEVRIGQTVVLKARAYPAETFEGKVISIAPVATLPSEEWSPDRTILVTTQLDNSRGLLKPEMTGHGKIYCGEYKLIDLTTRRLVRYVRVEFWSWW